MKDVKKSKGVRKGWKLLSEGRQVNLRDVKVKAKRVSLTVSNNKNLKSSAQLKRVVV